MFEDQLQRLIGNLNAAHEAYYRSEVFGGPSLHFHVRAVRADPSRDFTSFAELTYSVLASWGMHRMGPKGSKMKDYSEFVGSLNVAKEYVDQLIDKSAASLSDTDWHNLQAAFCSLQIMRSAPCLVANSKVLAHWLPNLAAPIDREYTLRYLELAHPCPANLRREWDVFERIHRHFFHPVVRNEQFRAAANGWMEHRHEYPWDTSLLKTTDNLVIGMAKIQGADSE